MFTYLAGSANSRLIFQLFF